MNRIPVSESDIAWRWAMKRLPVWNEIHKQISNRVVFCKHHVETSYLVLRNLEKKQLRRDNVLRLILKDEWKLAQQRREGHSKRRGIMSCEYKDSSPRPPTWKDMVPQLWKYRKQTALSPFRVCLRCRKTSHLKSHHSENNPYTITD